MRLLIPDRVLSQSVTSPIVSKQNRFRKSLSGSAITEYALIGAGVLVACLAGLVMLGSTLSGIFHNMMRAEQLQPQIIASANAKVASLPASLTATAPTGAKGNTLAGSTSASTQEGITQTAGANGTTDSFAQKIADSAKQALANGDINQPQADLIMQVANKGHEIAAIEGVLQNAHETSNLNGTLTYNGQTYSLMGLNSLLNQTMMDYSTLRYQAGSAIQNSNPTLNKVLNSASSQITSLANNIYGSVRLPDEQAEYLTAFGGASSSTNQNSAHICTAEQHLDSGNHCVN